MTFMQAVLMVLGGVLLGVLFAYIYWRTRTPFGELVISRDDEGAFSYTLKLEEEPEGLHHRRYIFFKIKR